MPTSREAGKEVTFPESLVVKSDQKKIQMEVPGDRTLYHTARQNLEQKTTFVPLSACTDYRATRGCSASDNEVEGHRLRAAEARRQLTGLLGQLWGLYPRVPYFWLGEEDNLQLV